MWTASKTDSVALRIWLKWATEQAACKVTFLEVIGQVVEIVVMLVLVGFVPPFGGWLVSSSACIRQWVAEALLSTVWRPCHVPQGRCPLTPPATGKFSQECLRYILGFGSWCYLLSLVPPFGGGFVMRWRKTRSRSCHILNQKRFSMTQGGGICWNIFWCFSWLEAGFLLLKRWSLARL